MAKREEYKEELKWNVKDLFASTNDYENAFKDLESKIEKYKEYEGTLLKDSNSLYNFLIFDNEFSKQLERCYIYAHIQNDQDTMNTTYQTMYGKVSNLYEKYTLASSYIIPELLKSDYDLIEKYIKENPKLQEFARSLKEIYRHKKYTLSDKEEKLLAGISGIFNTPDDVYSLLTDADMRFGVIKNEEGKEITLDEKSYRKLIESSNREVRKNTFEKLFTTYGNFKNTYAGLLAGEVKNHNRVASVRGYSSALAASLYRNEIPTEIYDRLIKNVKKNIEPLSNYWVLKRKCLGVEELHIYDTYASITKSSNKIYSKEEAEDLLVTSLNVLGNTYIEDLKKAFKERWIDFAPNEGKRNGAYCTACYLVHPYVLLSFDGTLNSVSTLAHELGHAMHYYYAINNQAYQDYGYSIFVAEVASQVNQILLSKYLIANTSDIEEKKYLIDDLIKDFKATIYRQTMFADFEKRMHESEAKGEVLTHEVLCDLYYELNKEYQGDNLVIDDIIRYEWERIPHFYMNFYVYQYATAYAAAIKIAMDILHKKEKALDKYLDFLKLGCTIDPIASLKVAGVDMNSDEVLNDAFTYFKDLVEELTNLYKEGEKNE